MCGIKLSWESSNYFALFLCRSMQQSFPARIGSLLGLNHWSVEFSTQLLKLWVRGTNVFSDAWCSCKLQHNLRGCLAALEETSQNSFGKWAKYFKISCFNPPRCRSDDFFFLGISFECKDPLLEKSGAGAFFNKRSCSSLPSFHINFSLLHLFSGQN